MMRRKAYAAIFAVLVTGFVVAASFNYRGLTTAAPLSPSPATELLGMLPASDAIAFVDARRALSEVVPHIFTDATMLGRVNQEIEKFREHTGTDARSIDSIAVSARFGKNSKANPEFVAGLVRGSFTASTAITNGIQKAKAEAEAKKRAFTVTEQQYQGTTIYEVERSGGFCMAAIDSNTIAFGDLGGIKAIVDVRAGSGARVDSSLVELATMNASAVAGFAANVPPSAAKQIAGSDEMFGEAFNSIRQIYGSADATGSMGALNVTLRSESGEKAQALAEKLGSLKQLASFYFSRATASQQSGAQTGTLSAVPGGTQVRLRDITPFAKWIKDVTITAEGSDVRIRLEEPLADMAGLICGR